MIPPLPEHISASMEPRHRQVDPSSPYFKRVWKKLCGGLQAGNSNDLSLFVSDGVIGGSGAGGEDVGAGDPCPHHCADDVDGVRVRVGEVCDLSEGIGACNGDRNARGGFQGSGGGGDPCHRAARRHRGIGPVRRNEVQSMGGEIDDVHGSSDDAGGGVGGVTM